MSVRVRVCTGTRMAGVTCATRRKPQPESRWSARREARTNDLDAGEDRRMLVVSQPREVRSCSSPPHAEGSRGEVRGVALPYLGARAKARRRDGRWGEPGDGGRPLILSGTSVEVGGDRKISGVGRDHQLIGTRARTGHLIRPPRRRCCRVGQEPTPRLRAREGCGNSASPACGRPRRLPPRLARTAS